MSAVFELPPEVERAEHDLGKRILDEGWSGPAANRLRNVYESERMRAEWQLKIIGGRLEKLIGLMPQPETEERG